MSLDPNLQTTIAGTPAADPFLGRTVDGKYKVLFKIGSGGMGSVYKAEHSLMGRMVAIKILHPHLVENEELLKRFQHEARTASRLRHPNAITTYDFGIFEEAPFIVMEFVEGRTLKQLISQNGPLPFRRVRDIFLQVAAALSQAHALGIVHRDLKPDNIMLVPQADGSESAVVLDFGIAKTLSQSGGGEHRTVLTQSGTFFGTPKYASPEQISEKSLDGRSDIYTLGIILYETLSGEVPFDAPSMMEILIKQINQEPISLRRFKPGLKISESVDELVLRCLRKRADDRFQSLSELIKALKEVNERRLGPAILIGGSAVLVCMLGGAGWWWLVDHRADEERQTQNAENAVATPTPKRGLDTQHPEVVAAERYETNSETAIDKRTVKESQKQGQQMLAALGSLGGFFGSSSVEDSPQIKDILPPARTRNDDVTEATEAEPETKPDLAQEAFLRELSADATADTAVFSESVPPESVPPESSSSIIEQDIVPSDSVPGRIPDVQPMAAIVPLVSPTPLPPATPTNQLSETPGLRKELERVEGGKKEAIDLYNQGRKLYERQRYSEAAVKFEQAVQLRSDAVGSFISLGNCYLRLQRTEAARQAFLKAVQVAPSYGPAHYNLAAFYALNGEQQLAIQSLRKSISLDPRARRVAGDEPDFRNLRPNKEFQRLLD